MKTTSGGAENLRWGLSQLIDLYLDRQESIVSKYCDQYRKSDICLIQSAENCISHVKQGAFTSCETAANRLREEVAELDIVINRNGALKDRAAAIKETYLEYIEQLRGKEAVGV